MSNADSSIEKRISRLSHFTSTLTQQLIKVNQLNVNASGEGEEMLQSNVQFENQKSTPDEFINYCNALSF